jgi:hypothetical protein
MGPRRLPRVGSYANFCRMRPALFTVGLIFLAVAVQAVPQPASAPAAQQPPAAPERKIPCKTPENASLCYWTRGRLNFYNFSPAYRIWKVGTKRIVGVYSGPRAFPPRTNEDSEAPEFPANLNAVFAAEYQRNRGLKQFAPELIGPVFADFELCPLEPEQAGQMQAVCIESVRNIFVEMSKRGYR